MTYNSQMHHRRSIRLRGYDYSQVGAYFVTVCTQDRTCLFGEVAGDQARLNEVGRFVQAEWDRLTDRFPTIELDTFVVMPNHVHGIVIISFADARSDSGVGAGLVPAPPVSTGISGVTEPGATTRVAPTRPGDDCVAGDGGRKPNTGATVDLGVGTGLVPAPILGDIVGAFKSLTTDLYIRGVRQSGWPGFRRRLWQRNYYEHIIRSDESLNWTRQYILDNPANWDTDEENPLVAKPKKRA